MTLDSTLSALDDGILCDYCGKIKDAAVVDYYDEVEAWACKRCADEVSNGKI